MTPAQAVDVQIADESDIEAAVQRALAEADVTLDQLIDMARHSQFVSERARLAWFAISPFLV
ncbi:MAG: hypothetical protein ACYDEY_10685 [Acidimicrobiales bacterium]